MEALVKQVASNTNTSYSSDNSLSVYDVIAQNIGKVIYTEDSTIDARAEADGAFELGNAQIIVKPQFIRIPRLKTPLLTLDYSLTLYHNYQTSLQQGDTDLLHEALHLLGPTARGYGDVQYARAAFNMIPDGVKQLVNKDITSADQLTSYNKASAYWGRVLEIYCK